MLRSFFCVGRQTLEVNRSSCGSNGGKVGGEPEVAVVAMVVEELGVNQK